MVEPLEIMLEQMGQIQHLAPLPLLAVVVVEKTEALH
jgi:hypothetical protein